MATLLNLENYIFLMAIVMALLSLAANKPALSALALFIEIALICLYFFNTFGSISVALISSLFLGTIVLALLGANIYLGMAGQSSPVTISKTNILFGTVAIFGFWFMDHSKVLSLLLTAQKFAQFFNPNTFGVITILFTLISVCIAALNILYINDRE